MDDVAVSARIYGLGTEPVPCRRVLDFGTLQRDRGVDRSVQRHAVISVEAVFGALRPIAMIVGCPDHTVAIIEHEQVVPWQNRRRQGAEIGEDEPRRDLDLCDALPDLFVQPAPWRLRRHFEAAPRRIIEPTMVAAAKAALLDPPERKRRSPMRAYLVEHPNPSVAVAEENEILAKEPYRQRFLFDLLGEPHRPPIAPQH